MNDEGRLPVVLRRAGAARGSVWVSGAKSSQYLSALLFMAPLIGEKVEIEVRDGLSPAPWCTLRQR